MCQMVSFDRFNYLNCSEHDLKISLFLQPAGLQTKANDIIGNIIIAEHNFL